MIKTEFKYETVGFFDIIHYVFKQIYIYIISVISFSLLLRKFLSLRERLKSFIDPENVVEALTDKINTSICKRTRF